ncbi:hypothetical protein Tdes44962_MAKER02391 [Teratosphaeria destructans]|uniref:Uncharacterized protein n=1 Tax=Teratosphaeria destructans TaxID=418781 RepID=A0A9W7W327_9PEZI|nr:hypothetical protein Tdes44962_MAKER02391 [Teratosphaeria destructans]
MAPVGNEWVGPSTRATSAQGRRQSFHMRDVHMCRAALGNQGYVTDPPRADPDGSTVHVEPSC